MLKKYQTLNRILDAAIVAVIRGENIEEGKRVIRACLKGGIKAIEVTYTLPNASEIIKELKKENLDGVIIGAGTVLDETTARLAILSGADFIVSPNFDKNTAQICNLYQIPYIPGCMTVTEITMALKYGVDIIKLFPANNFESNFIKSLKAPFPNIDIMPTGGISLDNVESWFKNGASVVGAGGKLASGSDDEIITTAQGFIKKISELKNFIGG
ncbi:bifunctional 2-keto-4-hydroxyglutarate aldolase/2-keto-3-deoxy-6-phosphogluconate aldolase [Fusobacterium periodonticum]|uniref:bifunctional 2-keto-4-hydroxyglutarate aldolase/2-keto-3-deoxy-6-phosphogluconate aldolase n=1 Tax=Fusobacterium periodonticum TaxID=860 RepID=UPI0028D883B9|nr:bifunctional 2-keto-4-hydroxyglutarate aldolase/2-keto-3-deoxy-6-phosphogluconate aldolase [Fusobacterium periodonticum]